MMLYSVCPYQYAAALASGINLFALNACGTFQSQLNALGGAAFSAGIAGGHAGTGDGIIGWFHRDEPDGDNVAAASLPGPPPGVPGLSFLTLTNHFYTGAAALPVGPGIYPPLIAKADVVGFDLYPLQEWCRPERMADVFYAQRELVNLAAGSRPSSGSRRTTGSATAPTRSRPATVRAESWLAIAGGAHGLGFWPASWDPGMNKVIAGVARDVDRLGPVIYVPGPGRSQPACPAERPHLVGSAVRDRRQLRLVGGEREDDDPRPERPPADRDGGGAAREQRRQHIQRSVRSDGRAHLHRPAGDS
jgi:hypothetical protein